MRRAVESRSCSWPTAARSSASAASAICSGDRVSQAAAAGDAPRQPAGSRGRAARSTTRATRAFFEQRSGSTHCGADDDADRARDVTRDDEHNVFELESRTARRAIRGDTDRRRFIASGEYRTLRAAYREIQDIRSRSS
jgi:hypothetical protein